VYIATQKIRELYEEARQVASDYMAATLPFPKSLYDYNSALALMCEDLGDHTAAVRYACHALDAFHAVRSGAAKHPKVGLVHSVNVELFMEIERLASLATQTDSS